MTRTLKQQTHTGYRVTVSRSHVVHVFWRVRRTHPFSSCPEKIVLAHVRFQNIRVIRSSHHNFILWLTVKIMGRLRVVARGARLHDYENRSNSVQMLCFSKRYFTWKECSFQSRLWYFVRALDAHAKTNCRPLIFENTAKLEFKLAIVECFNKL